MKMVMFSSFNFSWKLSSIVSFRLDVLAILSEHLAETLESKFPTEVERRENYHFHRP